MANQVLHALCPEYASDPAEEEEIAPPSNRPLNEPLAVTDVFVDDCVQLGQGAPKRMKAIRRHLWEAVDESLAKPEVSDTPRNEAVSLSKLEKGGWSLGHPKDHPRVDRRHSTPNSGAARAPQGRTRWHPGLPLQGTADIQEAVPEVPRKATICSRCHPGLGGTVQRPTRLLEQIL